MQDKLWAMVSPAERAERSLSQLEAQRGHMLYCRPVSCARWTMQERRHRIALPFNILHQLAEEGASTCVGWRIPAVLVAGCI